MATYSFLDVNVAITDPAGSFSISPGGGIAEEGITIAMEGDKTAIVWGCDGTPMTSLHAAQGGIVSIRLQKTSPTNSLMSSLYNQTTNSSANCGNSTITVRNPTRGDTIVCLGCSIRKFPDNVNAKEGGMNDWVFMAGIISPVLGDGKPNSTTILAG
jgi:hypothetical protein